MASVQCSTVPCCTGRSLFLITIIIVIVILLYLMQNAGALKTRALFGSTLTLSPFGHLVYIPPATDVKQCWASTGCTIVQ